VARGHTGERLGGRCLAPIGEGIDEVIGHPRFGRHFSLL
jgi:hypothetical protein